MPSCIISSDFLWALSKEWPLRSRPLRCSPHLIASLQCLVHADTFYLHSSSDPTGQTYNQTSNVTIAAPSCCLFSGHMTRMLDLSELPLSHH